MSDLTLNVLVDMTDIELAALSVEQVEEATRIVFGCYMAGGAEIRAKATEVHGRLVCLGTDMHFEDHRNLAFEDWLAIMVRRQGFDPTIMLAGMPVADAHRAVQLVFEGLSPAEAVAIVTGGNMTGYRN